MATTATNQYDKSSRVSPKPSPEFRDEVMRRAVRMMRFGLGMPTFMYPQYPLEPEHQTDTETH
jgi:hypothetical protein